MKQDYFKSAIVKTLLICISVAATALAGEGVVRLLTNTETLPGYVFHEGYGILHDPKAPGVNALGFMDKERALQKPDGVYRVLLLGDSFIDGAKVDVYLEQALAKAMPDRQFEVIPMGISGTGTLEHLMFFEKIGRQFHPDMVVDVFVPNDFANNSNILEAIRLRFDPNRPGRNFVHEVYDGTQYVMEPIPASADYHERLLKELPPHPQQSVFLPLERRLNTLFSNSYLYNFITNRIYAIDEDSLFHRFDAEYAYRYCQLSANPGIKEKFKGWAYPYDLDMDAMFLVNEEPLPQVFSDALKYTQYAFHQFERYAKEDHFVFIEAFSDSCTYFPASWLKDWRKYAERAHRTIDPQNFVNRLEALCKAESVMTCDLYPTFAKRGDLVDAHLEGDNHWNETGKRYAAEDIAHCIASALSK